MDFKDLDLDLIKRHLPKAIISGIVLSILLTMVLAGSRPNVAKQSYEFWTRAQPFHINDQYQLEGDSVWVVEIENDGNSSIELYGVDAIGNGTQTHWMLPNASLFEAHASKLLLIPVQKVCQKDGTFVYSLNITYARIEGPKETEVGKYPIFGRCLPRE